MLQAACQTHLGGPSRLVRGQFLKCQIIRMICRYKSHSKSTIDVEPRRLPQVVKTLATIYHGISIFRRGEVPTFVMFRKQPICHIYRLLKARQSSETSALSSRKTVTGSAQPSSLSGMAPCSRLRTEFIPALNTTE